MAGEVSIGSFVALIGEMEWIANVAMRCDQNRCDDIVKTMFSEWNSYKAQLVDQSLSLSTSDVGLSSIMACDALCRMIGGICRRK